MLLHTAVRVELGLIHIFLCVLCNLGHQSYGFDRVLAAVQRNARMRSAALTGRVMEGLVEEVNAQKEGYVTCRLSCNMIVHVPGDASMIGQYVPVLLEECRGFYYFGRILDERN